jgi:hypothetical protein
MMVHMTEPDPLVLKGTLTTFRRRCGKPSCRCATGEPHTSPALTFYEDGRTRTVTLRPEEVDEVAAAVARYDEAAERLRVAAEQGLAAFRARRQARR